jgi:AraC-like DNA-binding protein
MSGRFARVFILQLLFIFLLLFSIYYLYGNYAEEKIQKGLQAEASNELSLFNASLDNLMQQIKNMTVQFSLDPAINSLLKDPYNTSKYDYILVRDELTKVATSNDLLYSMYLHIRINDKVITTSEGIYNRKEFYDRGLLNDYFDKQRQSPEYQYRVLTDQDQKPVKLLTIIQKLPVYKEEALGGLVVNVREDALIHSLNQLDGHLAGNMFIENNRLINWDRKGLTGEDIDDMLADLDRSEKGFVQVKSKKESYYAIVLKSASPNWTYVKMISERRYQSLLNHEKKNAVYIMCLLFLICLGASFFMLRNMFAPWKQLLSRLNPSNQPHYRRTFLGDEIKAVNHSVDRMLQENHQFRQSFEEQLQIVRDKLLMDLLWGQIYDRTQLEERMGYCQFTFPGPKFIIVVAAIDNLSKEAIGDYPKLLAAKIHAKHIIEQVFSRKIAISGVLLDENYLAFILNIDRDIKHDWLRKTLASACTAVNKLLMKRNSGFVSFSFGPPVNDLFKLRDSFMSARRRINYRSFFHDHIAFHDEQEESAEYEYPMQLQKEIINGIKTGNPEVIKHVLDPFFEQAEESGNYVYPDIQQALSLLMSGVMSELWMQGEDLRGLLSVSKIRKILECENKDRLKEQIYEHFLAIMDVVSSERKSEANKKVAEMIKIMEKRYTEVFSIQQLADEVMLTPAYLSRIFKESTGRTPLEYLTYQRIKRSFDLLRVEELTIKEIAERVGYREVRSYIRFFKRQEGVTPGEYRNYLFHS